MVFVVLNNIQFISCNNNLFGITWWYWKKISKYIFNYIEDRSPKPTENHSPSSNKVVKTCLRTIINMTIK